MKRLSYIDALRGLTILLVLYTHIVHLGIFGKIPKELDTGYIIPFLTRFRMPLFFCVSGFFAAGVYDARLAGRRLKNRLAKQLWPTFVVAMIYFYIVGFMSYGYFWLHPTKQGYWFTLALVETFIPYVGIAFVMNLLKVRQRTQVVVYAVICIATFGLRIMADKYNPGLLDSYWGRVLCWRKMWDLVTYFYFGVVLKMVLGHLNKAYDLLWPFVLMVVAMVGLCMIEEREVVRLSSYLCILVVVGLFYYGRNYFEKDTAVARTMILLGKNTLPIYLFHYIVLVLLRDTKILMPLRHIMGEWFEFPVIMLLSVIIAMVCLGVDILIKRVPYLHGLMFGDFEEITYSIRRNIFRKRLK